MKKSVKDQTTRAFQTGGYNPPVVPQPTQPYSQPTQVDPRTGTYTLPGTGIAGYQVPSGTPTGYTPYGGATPYFQPVQFTGAQYQTALQTTNLPTFAETVGSKPGQYDELRTYINDAGQTLQIPFKDGRPIYPIPEGYRPIGDQPAPEEEQTTVAPTVGKTTVRDEGGGDREVGVSGTGYKGLSTTRGTGKGGLSAAAEQARTDLGITGYAGIPGGGTLGVIADAFGFDVPSAFGTAPLEGMTGTLSQGQLASIANMNPIEAKNAGISTTPDVARAVMEAQSNYGVALTGVFGYKPGDINPTTGTAVGNHGMTVDSAFVGSAGTPPGAFYSSFSSMVATVTRGLETGWRGGFVSRSIYDNHMTDEQRNNYDNFDSRHKADKNFEDAVAESATTGESYSGSPRAESMADAVAAGRDPTGTAGVSTGQPVGMEDEYDDGPTADISDATPASRSQPSSPVGALDNRGDPSDTGKGGGGGGYGGGDQAGQAGDTGPSADSGAPD